MGRLVRFSLVLLFIAPFFLGASESKGHEEAHDKPSTEKSLDEKRAENGEFVKHHTKDSHDFHIVSAGDKHYGFPLPVILWDEGLHVFMSSAFEHGHKTVESKGNHYFLDNHSGKIFKTDAHGTMEHDEHGHVVNAMPIDLSITKNVAVTIIMCFILLWVFRSVAKSYRSGLTPTGPAKFFEPIIVFVRDEIAIPNIGEHSYKKYMNYLLTVFFFIWFLNLAGMTPLGINVTGNIAVTFGLAMLTFFITQVTAKKDYWLHIFWMPGVPVPMKILLAPIEVIGVFVKPFALMIRLYANMLAGHIVLGSLIAVVYYFTNYGAKGAFVGLTFFLNIIELLVALLQAYIFTMLTALYFGAAAATHDEHH